MPAWLSSFSKAELDRIRRVEHCCGKVITIVILGTVVSVSECITIHANSLGGAVGEEFLACIAEGR
jgi:hypothetical protein